MLLMELEANIFTPFKVFVSDLVPATLTEGQLPSFIKYVKRNFGIFASAIPRIATSFAFTI